MLTTVISDIYTTETTIFLEQNISRDAPFKLLKFLLRSKLILFPQPSLDVLNTVLPRYTDNSLYDTDGGSVKCHQYWPAHDSTLFYGDISVTCTCEVSTAGAKYNLATQISFLKINKNLNVSFPSNLPTSPSAGLCWTAACLIEANQAVYPLDLTRSTTVWKEGSVKPLSSFSAKEEKIYLLLKHKKI